MNCVHRNILCVLKCTILTLFVHSSVHSNVLYRLRKIFPWLASTVDCTNWALIPSLHFLSSLLQKSGNLRNPVPALFRAIFRKIKKFEKLENWTLWILIRPNETFSSSSCSCMSKSVAPRGIDYQQVSFLSLISNCLAVSFKMLIFLNLIFYIWLPGCLMLLFPYLRYLAAWLFVLSLLEIYSCMIVWLSMRNILLHHCLTFF